MPNILFLDSICPRPYDPDVLATEGLGCSEASVVRIAEFLATHLRDSNGANDGTVAVGQHIRTEIARYNATYGPIGPWLAMHWDVVVVVRRASVLGYAASLFPAARLIFWLQDLPDKRLHHPDFVRLQPLIVAVSSFHAQSVRGWFAEHAVHDHPEITYLYNPIDDCLCPDASGVDLDQLIFFSSPNKGLEYTLRCFHTIREAIPGLHLCVSNPGYRQWTPPSPLPQGVHYLGVLSHQEVMSHVRRSLCVFNLNNTFPETFGCVFAEANAVGTPVVAHPFGAAPEVLSERSQLVDTQSLDDVIRRVSEWRDGRRPCVRGDSRFRTTQVGEAWLRLVQSNQER